jgi:hypothetical protein
MTFTTILNATCFLEESPGEENIEDMYIAFTQELFELYIQNVLVVVSLCVCFRSVSIYSCVAVLA